MTEKQVQTQGQWPCGQEALDGRSVQDLNSTKQGENEKGTLGVICQDLLGSQWVRTTAFKLPEAGWEDKGGSLGRQQADVD